MKYCILICHSYGGSIGLRGTIGFGGIQVGYIGSLVSINTSKRFDNILSVGFGAIGGLDQPSCLRLFLLSTLN